MRRWKRSHSGRITVEQIAKAMVATSLNAGKIGHLPLSRNDGAQPVMSGRALCAAIVSLGLVACGDGARPVTPMQAALTDVDVSPSSAAAPTSSIAPEAKPPRHALVPCTDAPPRLTVKFGPFSPNDATVTLVREDQRGTVTMEKALTAEVTLAGSMDVNFSKDENWTLIIRKDGYATERVRVLPPCAGGESAISRSLQHLHREGGA
jgi:hypothetical protein